MTPTRTTTAIAPAAGGTSTPESLRAAGAGARLFRSRSRAKRGSG